MKVYLDYAATTPPDERVLKKMLPCMTEVFGNASSLHSYGRAALSAVDRARDEIASILHCSASEIFFTSGGTESDNWALRGVVSASSLSKKHIITTRIEHPAILSTCQELEKEGCEVTYVGVDEKGFVDPNDVFAAIRDNTVLVAVMTANNEIGTIQPIADIGALCRGKGIPFYTDAVQAVGSIRIDVQAMNIDMLGFSAHKIYGPKGVGVLYVKNGVRFDSLIYGGEQEHGKRAGTTNTPGIVGTAEALRLTVEEMEESNERIKALRDRFIERAEKEIPFCRLAGARENRLVGNADFIFDGIRGESLLMALDMAGIAVGSGSACSSGSQNPSHVILAIGGSDEDARSSVRFSFGKHTTQEEVDYVVDVLKSKVEKLRETTLFKVIAAKGKRL